MAQLGIALGLGLGLLALLFFIYVVLPYIRLRRERGRQGLTPFITVTGPNEDGTPLIGSNVPEERTSFLSQWTVFRPSGPPRQVSSDVVRNCCLSLRQTDLEMQYPKPPTRPGR